MKIFKLSHSLSVALLIVFIFIVPLNAQNSSGDTVAEVLEWTAIAGIAGADIYLRFQEPFFEEPLIDSPYTNLKFKENTVSTLWIVLVDVGAAAAIGFLPNNGGEGTSYKNLKGFLESVAITNFLTDLTKNVIGRKR